MRLRSLLEKKSASNVSEATVQLLKKLAVPVTATTAIEGVEGHPDFPSLYSISDSLAKWKIENAAFQVEAAKLDDLPTPFIAHTKRGGGSFVTVSGVNGTVDFVNEKGKAEKAIREDFLKTWTNTVLLAEKSPISGEGEYHKKKRAETIAALRIPLFAAAGLSLVVLYAVVAGGTVAATALLTTKLLGCIVAGLLLWFEVDKANPVLQQICSGGKSTNCSAVLSSKSARLFNWLSWSEVGFYYFTGGFLALLLTANWQLPTLGFLAWVNLFALPYTVFSVYYQWRVAKQWCPLCLTVQALLITEAIICYFSYWSSGDHQPTLPGANALIILTSFLLPGLFWAASKNAFLDAQAGKRNKKELNKLKYNKEIFTALLQKQKAIATSTEGLGITLGNPNAVHTLVKVCNPYCGPCAKAHKVIDEMLESGDVKVQIIFTASNDDYDKKAAPVKHLMAIYEKADEARMQQALDDWYNAAVKDYEAFAKKYPVGNAKLKTQGATLEAMKLWSDETGISFTPTVFIDGYQLPEAYNIEDLKHFL